MGKTDAVKKKVSFSQFGHYNVLFEYFITHGLQQDYVTPPAITKRTMELGNRHSPDFVCSPFKFTLGCFLEAIEAGEDRREQEKQPHGKTPENAGFGNGAAGDARGALP